jgi:hypothetical protein
MRAHHSQQSNQDMILSFLARDTLELLLRERANAYFGFFVLCFSLLFVFARSPIQQPTFCFFVIVFVFVERK